MGASPMTKRRDSEADAATDSEAFRAAMRDVKRLAAAPARPSAPPRKRRRTPPAAPAPADLDADMPLVAADVGGEELLVHRKPGVREQTLRRLRRGLVPVEDALDLHGMSQAAARELLAEFLAAATARGLRCVRIVHGKGLRSGSRGAVLKSAVNSWLRRHAEVLAFVSARPIDGGAGAVYALLRA
jgi:DNA-nicking Smr family endonuclease